MPYPPGDISPTSDGQVQEYTAKSVVDTGYFSGTRRVIFINGMMNSGADHKQSAEALSELQMCPVIGVYNESHGFWADLGQCIGDKWQFDGETLARVGLIIAAPTDPALLVLVFASGLTAQDRFDMLMDRIHLLATAAGKNPPSRVKVMRVLLDRNPAAVALFDVLRDPGNATWEIFAHSQGNLITSNVLSAIELCDGKSAIAGRTVHSYGSPSTGWPSGLIHHEHAFSFDPVSYLNLTRTFDMRMSTVAITKSGFDPVTHSFMLYMENDARFVINRHRWSAGWFTAWLNADGLAKDLAAMGTNMQRVANVLSTLNAISPRWVPDVLDAYVKLIAADKAGGSKTASLAINHPDMKTVRNSSGSKSAWKTLDSLAAGQK